MIRRSLRVVWALPWPRRLRQVASDVVTLPGLRLIFLPHFMVGVVGVILDDQGRVLLLEHTYRARYPWGLPTGFVEHGEQPLEALAREIREETGYSVHLSPLPTVFVSASHPILSVLYRGTFAEGTFEPGPEIAAARFFGPSEFPHLNPDQDVLLRNALREDQA